MRRNHLHALRTGGACAVLVAAVGLAFACSESPTDATLDDLAPQFDRKGTGDCEPTPHNHHCHGEEPAPDPDPTATVVINTVMADAGIYGVASNMYSATLSDSGDLGVSIDCSGAIELDLTEQGLSSPFDNPIFTCAGGKGKSSASPRITVQNLLGASVDETLGAEFPHDGTNYSNVTNYYFVVEKTGYNVVYWNGIKVTGIVNVNCLNADGTRTYTLSTDPDLFVVELRERTKRGTVNLGEVTAHLDMIVTVTPCA